MLPSTRGTVAGGLTLLTDPNFLHRGQHAYLGYGLVSKRLKDPALRIDELPPIDAVVLSHMHGDHCDRVAQRGLDHGLPIVTTPDAAKRLHRRGFARARGLLTWQHHTTSESGTNVTITSLPGRHAPIGIHRLLPPVMGTMLEFASEDSPRRRLYVSGTHCSSKSSTRSPSVSTRSTPGCYTSAVPGCRPGGGFRSA